MTDVLREALPDARVAQRAVRTLLSQLQELDTVMIGSISDAVCELCDRVVAISFSLHEMAEGQWAVVCIECEQTLELLEGK